MPVDVGPYEFKHRELGPEDISWAGMKLSVAWCKQPYPGHPDGCVNVSKPCRFFRPGLKEYLDKCFDHPGVQPYIAWVEWNIDDFELRMSIEHPGWPRARLRNLCWWQPALRKALWDDCIEQFGWSNIILGPEGSGVDIYHTMLNFDIVMDRPEDLHTIRVTAIVTAFNDPDLGNELGGLFPSGMREKDHKPIDYEALTEQILAGEDLEIY